MIEYRSPALRKLQFSKIIKRLLYVYSAWNCRSVLVSIRTNLPFLQTMKLERKLKAFENFEFTRVYATEKYVFLKGSCQSLMLYNRMRHLVNILN